MFYIVCVYIVVCLSALVFLPTNIPEERAKKSTIFDDDIEKKVKEHLKDIPDLNLGD